MPLSNPISGTYRDKNAILKTTFTFEDNAYKQFRRPTKNVLVTLISDLDRDSGFEGISEHPVAVHYISDGLGWICDSWIICWNRKQRLEKPLTVIANCIQFWYEVLRRMKRNSNCPISLSSTVPHPPPTPPPTPSTPTPSTPTPTPSTPTSTPTPSTPHPSNLPHPTSTNPCAHCQGQGALRYN